MTALSVFIGILAARLIDPLAILLCAGSAAMIGQYRVAVPVGAVIYLVLALSLSKPSAISLAASIIAGASLSALGLFIWRKVPHDFKKAFIRDDSPR